MVAESPFPIGRRNHRPPKKKNLRPREVQYVVQPFTTREAATTLRKQTLLGTAPGRPIRRRPPASTTQTHRRSAEHLVEFPGLEPHCSAKKPQERISAQTP